MTLPAWHEEPIAKAHDLKVFDCGNAELNVFLQKHARQSHRSGGAEPFCAIYEGNPGRALGYYSLVRPSLGGLYLARSRDIDL